MRSRLYAKHFHLYFLKTNLHSDFHFNIYYRPTNFQTVKYSLNILFEVVLFFLKDEFTNRINVLNLDILYTSAGFSFESHFKCFANI